MSRIPKEVLTMIDNIPKNPFINFSSEKADKNFDYEEVF